MSAIIHNANAMRDGGCTCISLHPVAILDELNETVQDKMLDLLMKLFKEISDQAVKLLKESVQPDSAAVRDASAIAAALCVLLGKSPKSSSLADSNGNFRNLLYLLGHAPAEQCPDFAALLSTLGKGEIATFEII
jgi:hypothetical protein